MAYLLYLEPALQTELSCHLLLYSLWTEMLGVKPGASKFLGKGEQILHLGIMVAPSCQVTHPPFFLELLVPKGWINFLVI